MVSDKQLSIGMTMFFLRVAGFGIHDNPKDKRFLDATLTYTIIAVLWGIAVVWSDCYFSRTDFYRFAYSLTPSMAIFIVVLKIFVFTAKRDSIIELIRYSKENFWDAEYDIVGKKILKNCEKQCVFICIVFAGFANATVSCYIFTPMIENIGKNETDRRLPFTIWLDLPLTTSPYFEILYVIQSLSIYHYGILYFCFDNLLFIFNIHTVAQFQILSRRLEDSCDVRIKDENYGEEELIIDDKHISDSGSSLARMKLCIQQHQKLISFVERVESMYSLTTLGQVVVFSLLTCLIAYQAFLADGPFLRRFIFLVQCIGTFIQLFVFTLTCHNLADGSTIILSAAYRSGWYLLEDNADTNAFKKNIILMIMRAKRPCELTAFGFFPITLETFMKINSTAVSYLTILRQSAMDDDA